MTSPPRSSPSPCWPPGGEPTRRSPPTSELIDLTISGDGSLTVTGGGTVSESYGIYTDNLIVQSGTVNATGGNAGEDSSYGIYADYVTITGGTTPASQTTVDGKLTSLPTSTRDGYDFLGWYTAGGDRVTTDTVFAADTTLYAR